VDLLEMTTVGTLMKRTTPFLKLSGETPVKEALELLAFHKILSVPVWDKLEGSWLGFLDCADIVAFAINLLTRGKEIQPDDWGHFSQEVKNLMHCDIVFSTLPIKQIINASTKDLFIPVFSHGTLYQLVEDVFFQGIHRVPVFDDYSLSKMLDVISMSDVMNFLGHHMDFLETFGDRTVQELKLGTRGAVVAPINVPAIHAFYLMNKYKVSSVAVVNPSNGNLLANLSVTDIRGLAEHRFQTLLHPIHQFFLASKGTIVPPVTCTLNTDFSTVIRKMVYFRIHRIWITDLAGKPIGVVSQKDIMRVLIPEEEISETVPKMLKQPVIDVQVVQVPVTATAV